MSSTSRIRVMLLFGGRSGEHPISCATAAGVMRAIDQKRFEVLPVGITKDGRWVEVDPDPATWEIKDGKLPEVVPASAGEVTLSLDVGSSEARVVTDNEPVRSLGHIDVVFPLLHGPFGEDGTVQGLLELADIRYVGPGVLASAVGMDKHFMKVVLQGSGIPVGPYEFFTADQWDRDSAAITKRVERLAYPLFVKPARAGSSLGITRISEPSQLADAVAEARRHDARILVEQGIEGREIECAVLQGRAGAPTRASLPGEIMVSHAEHTFYDFEAKYLDESSVTLSCPADLPSDVVARVQRLAIDTFEALACEGLSRVDVFVTPTGDVIVNEINTMPGFTPFSMYPVMWQASGMPYEELVDELLALALERPLGLR
ncbi:D-alanine--D-alanine ligase family protein [Rarobacter incanus]|uniref:D-alanine--D-alanine ligase n=1 Tax=Rarobacter incanus TaxID=153494 RepID=A0A542SRJ2_9MICO|nr:D-alanine--D-alanine ligase family protein [Rarobacter incanus]TQK77240.1 D-alanine--D-alanine ligase [Rarobacter incanus]